MKFLGSNSKGQLGTIGKTVEDTVLMLNSHSETLMKTVAAADALFNAHTQLVTMFTSDLIRELALP